MGIFDKAKDLVHGHGDKIKDGIDKAADVIKSKVPDQHDDKVEAARAQAKGLLDKLPE